MIFIETYIMIFFKYYYVWFNIALSKSIAVSIENNQEVQPAACHVNVNKKNKLFMNALFIQKKIYDNANWEMWEAYQLVKAHNPNAILCGQKVDLLAYRNVTNSVPNGVISRKLNLQS